MMDTEKLRNLDWVRLAHLDAQKRRRRRWRLVKIIWIAAAAMWIFALTSAAFSQTVRMEVTVKVVNPADTSLTLEEFGQVREIGSTAWWVKQCCMQITHRAGIRSVECVEEPVKSKVDEPTCEALGVALIEPVAGE